MNSSLPSRKIDDFQIVNLQSDHDLQDWSEHEHVADSVNKEAQHLIQPAGSPELAKQAIDTINESEDRMRSAVKEELARDLGYCGIPQMMEQTEIVILSSGSYMHLTTDADGFWVAWSDKPFYDFQRYESRQQALTSLRESEEQLPLES